MVGSYNFYLCQDHDNDLSVKWSSVITRLTTHCTCGLMSDLVICKHRKEYGRT